MSALRAVDNSGWIASLHEPLLERLKRNDASLRELGGFGHYTVDQISSALVENTTVTSFKFNNCELDDSGCATIMQALAARHSNHVSTFCLTCRPRTKRISLARNRIGIDGARHIAKFLGSPHAHAQIDDVDPSVYHKSNAICRVCNGERIFLPRFMEDFIRLDLLSNKIKDAGATAIAYAIAAYDSNINARSHCIVELGLERNGITDVGLMTISQMLKTNNTLHTLQIGRNLIGHEGILQLSEALKVNNTLETLSLTGNHAIGDEGAKALGSSLAGNRALKTLLLKKCGISDRGGTHLLEALYCDKAADDLYNSSNHSLIEVSLCSRNVFYCSAKTSFENLSTCGSYPQRGLSLRVLLSWNNLGCATAQRLKFGFFLCSGHGARYVHSLELDRRLFPPLLCKLWKINRGEYSFKTPTNLEVLWCYLRGMPQVVEGHNTFEKAPTQA